MFTRMRYFFIQLLAGDMPVVLNMNILNPEGYEGTLIELTRGPCLFCNNYIDCCSNTKRTSILSARRDVDPNNTKECIT